LGHCSGLEPATRVRRRSVVWLAWYQPALVITAYAGQPLLCCGKAKALTGSAAPLPASGACVKL
jgi:hypothetical protein